jgi:hypothetical protein
VVKEKGYFAQTERRAGTAVPAGDQSSRDGGVAPKYKVPGEIVLRVDSSRWFPGELETTKFDRW